MHDFGQSLLGALHTSPALNHSSSSDAGNQTPVVLIGHSMGGVVIKKTFLLAKQDAQYHALADRIHSMFFLGIATSQFSGMIRSMFTNMC